MSPALMAWLRLAGIVLAGSVCLYGVLWGMRWLLRKAVAEEDRAAREYETTASYGARL